MIQSSRAVLAIAGLWMLMSGAAASEPIYQVEMIVFERTSPPSAEAWPKNLELTYPQYWQRLFDPQQELERQRTAATEAHPGDMPDSFLQTLERESAERRQSDGTAALAIAEPASLPEFFAFLPSEKRGLQKAREALDRSATLRVLFHEAWRQPFTTLEKSPALILHGGHQYGAHYELQGYIHLGLSRFLHLQTNLWFTHFAPNHGQVSEHWPNLPEEPASLSSSDQAEAPPDHTPEMEATSELEPWEGNYFADLPQEPYVVNQIVTLQQKRRLRSGELHYLDHPKLGILIRILPEKP
jgi:hypothetical protein